MSDDRDWIDELYAEGRDEAPPAGLDAAIRSAARENAARPWYRDLRYLTTVATAASFVLAAMIVYYAPRDPEGVPSTPEVQRDAPTAAREATFERSVERETPDALAPAPTDTISGSSADAALEEAVPAPEPAAAPAAPARTPSTTGRQAQAEAAAKRVESAAMQPASLTPSERRLESDAADNDLKVESMSDTMVGTNGTTSKTAAILLAERCGELPGTADARTLAQDALGWYLTVRDGEATTYYRCRTDRWFVIDGPVVADTQGSGSDQQQPDPEDDQ